MYVIKVKVTVTKNRKSVFPLNIFSLLWPIDTKLAVWVAYIKTQLGKKDLPHITCIFHLLKYVVKEVFSVSHFTTHLFAKTLT